MASATSPSVNQHTVTRSRLQVTPELCLHDRTHRDADRAEAVYTMVLVASLTVPACMFSSLNSTCCSPCKGTQQLAESSSAYLSLAVSVHLQRALILTAGAQQIKKHATHRGCPFPRCRHLRQAAPLHSSHCSSLRLPEACTSSPRKRQWQQPPQRRAAPIALRWDKICNKHEGAVNIEMGVQREALKEGVQCRTPIRRTSLNLTSILAPIPSTDSYSAT